jgi:hypothetical protein
MERVYRRGWWQWDLQRLLFAAFCAEHIAFMNLVSATIAIGHLLIGTLLAQFSFRSENRAEFI